MPENKHSFSANKQSFSPNKQSFSPNKHSFSANNLSGEFVLIPESPGGEKDSGKSVRPTSIKPYGHKHKNAHFFSSLCYYPNNVTFKDQEADEEVVLLIRRDLITNVPWIASAIGLSILPVLFLFISTVLPQFFQIPVSLINTALFFYYTVVFGFILLEFTLWYFNVGIVTNKRVIDLDVANILTRELTEARLATIQDVTLTQVGGIRSIFNYGDIDIQTEALKQNIEFYRVPDPNFIRRVIGDLVVNKEV
jgi:hypothetical protein